MRHLLRPNPGMDDGPRGEQQNRAFSASEDLVVHTHPVTHYETV
jgi:hypothetical protein